MLGNNQTKVGLFFNYPDYEGWSDVSPDLEENSLQILILFSPSARS